MEILRSRKILITGASSGIGKATAELLSKHAPRLILVSRNLDKLKSLAEDLKAKHPGLPYPTCFSCDISNQEDVDRILKTCQNLFGSIDVLINNAGCGVYGESDKMSIEDFRKIMNVNFFGAISCMYGVLPLMKKNGGGQIINISSVAALHGVPYLSAYGASKAALASVSQSIRAELHKENIRINIIYPGYTRTDFFVKEKRVGSAVRPQGPYMPVENVARAIENTIYGKERDLVIGWEGKILILLKKIHPAIVDWIMDKIATKLK